MKIPEIRMGSFWKVVLAILGLGFFTLIIIGLFRFGSFLAFLWIFPWATDRLVRDVGMNIWLARCIAVGVSVLIVYAGYLMFSSGKNKKFMGLALLVGGFVMYSLTMFYMTREYNFNSNGASSKCFAVTPNGIDYVSCAYSVHPVYGTKVQPLTKEIIFSQNAKVSGVPKINRIKPNKDMCFFASDGTPLLWYYQYPDGRLEFFDQPGRHHQLNISLSPVNSEIVNQFFQYLNEGKVDLIILDGQMSKDNNPKEGLQGLRDFLVTMKPQKKGDTQ